MYSLVYSVWNKQLYLKKYFQHSFVFRGQEQLVYEGYTYKKYSYQDKQVGLLLIIIINRHKIVGYEGKGANQKTPLA